jgi:hypothetical protein
LRVGKEQSDIKDWKSSTEEMNQQDESDAKRYKPGELLSCDNVGPVNLKSFEGYVCQLSTKRMFSHSEIIRLYYKRHGIKIKVNRSDDFTTFKSRKVRAYYAK